MEVADRICRPPVQPPPYPYTPLDCRVPRRDRGTGDLTFKPDEPDTLLNCSTTCPKCSDDIHFGFDQFRCTRLGQLVVGGGSPRRCRPAAFLQVLALLPVGRDLSQDCQIRLRIAVLQEFLNADRREDCHDCSTSLVSGKFVGSSGSHPTAPRKSYSHRCDGADSYSL
jgi:hypothetical protein